MSDFTYEKSSLKGYVVRVPAGTSVKYNYTYRKLLGLVFKVTKDHEAIVITRNDYVQTISLNLYAQLPDDDKYIPHAWKHVVGVLVDNEEQAKELVDELDKARMWALLKR